MGVALPHRIQVDVLVVTAHGQHRAIRRELEVVNVLSAVASGEPADQRFLPTAVVIDSKGAAAKPNGQDVALRQDSGFAASFRAYPTPVFAPTPTYPRMPI
eukprot:scaffold2133_cov259-Pinguiococcus_pyrenoidosus.AAC.3